MSLPILITGGSQRLGLAIAQDLLSRDQPVIITYRRYKPAVDQLKQAGATVLEADFSTQAGISRAIDEINAFAVVCVELSTMHLTGHQKPRIAMPVNSCRI